MGNEFWSSCGELIIEEDGFLNRDGISSVRLRAWRVFGRNQVVDTGRSASGKSRGVRAAACTALLVGLGLTNVVVGSSAGTVANAAVGPVGSGFTVTPSDLAFILRQIKIAERHSRAFQGTEPTQAPNPDVQNDPQYCASLLPGPLTSPVVPDVFPDQVPDYLTTYGLRTVDGGCNNLAPAALLNPDGSPATNSDGTPILKYQTGRADEQFPRLSAPVFRAAEEITQTFPVGPPGPTSYAQKSGSVFDSQPRVSAT